MARTATARPTRRRRGGTHQTSTSSSSGGSGPAADPKPAFDPTKTWYGDIIKLHRIRQQENEDEDIRRRRAASDRETALLTQARLARQQKADAKERVKAALRLGRTTLKKRSPEVGASANGSSSSSVGSAGSSPPNKKPRVKPAASKTPHPSSSSSSSSVSSASARSSPDRTVAHQTNRIFDYFPREKK